MIVLFDMCHVEYVSDPVKLPSETIISALNKPALGKEVKSIEILPLPLPVEVNVDGTSTLLTFALKVNSSSALSTSL